MVHTRYGNGIEIRTGDGISHNSLLAEVVNGEFGWGPSRAIECFHSLRMCIVEQTEHVASDSG